MRVKLLFIAITALGLIAMGWLHTNGAVSLATKKEATLAFAGLGLALAGYLIKYRKQYNLIAGYDPERDGEPVYEANLIGGGALILGAILLIASVVLYLRA